MEILFNILWIFFITVGALAGMVLGHLEEPDDPFIALLFGFLGGLLGIIYFVIIPMFGLYLLSKYLANKFIRVEYPNGRYGGGRIFYIGNWKIN